MVEWVWTPPAPAPDEDESELKEPAVAAAEVVIKLRGVKAVEAKVARLEKDVARFQERYDKALEAGKKPQAEAAEKALTAKQEQLKGAKEALAAFVISAPKAGVFTPTVKKGQKLEAEAVVGMVSGAPVRTATFAVPDSSSFSEGDDIEVAAQSKPEAVVTCKVGAVEDGKVEVRCGGELDAGAVILPKVLIEE